MDILNEIEQIDSQIQKVKKIPSDIDNIFYRIKGQGEERKLTFYTYNIVHRLAWSAFIWIVILLLNYGAFHYGRFYMGVSISVVLILLVFTPIRTWVLDFKTDKVYSVFKIMWIPIARKEYSKKSFWNSKIEVIFYVFYYLGSFSEKEHPPEMENYYESLASMEEDVNYAIKYSDFAFVYITFMLVKKGKDKEIESSLPRGKFSFSNTRKIKQHENPFQVILMNFFTEKRLKFLKAFVEFFPLSKHYLDEKDGPKTHNQFSCSLTKTEKKVSVEYEF
ncbi:MAG: hypothetical protein FK733_09430 [Asgard group archaeon]|nr:hypothetical protein [Asgard group archaeon]